jgi:hypothetical protein
VSGAQYVDDPFGHLDHATRHGLQLRALVLDTWTRPVPNLLFWAAGRLGIDLAFVVPVVLTLAALGLCASLAARVLGGAQGTAADLALLALPFFLIQHAVLETGYLTLTEVPYLLVATWSLAWFADGRPGRRAGAYVLAGALPLCRPEGVVVAPALGLAFLWSERIAGPRRHVVARLLLLGAAPLLWWGAGLLLTGDPLWYLHRNTYRGVASLRDGPLVWILVCNGVTMLPRLLPVLVLPLVLIGLWALPRRARANGVASFPAFVLLATQFATLSLVRTGPDAWADFHAAGLTRMYAGAAPALALLAAAGFLELRTALARGAPPRSATVPFAAALAVLVLALPRDVLEHVGQDQVPANLYLRGATGAGLADLWEPLRAAMANDLHGLRYLLLIVALVGVWVGVAWRPARALRDRAVGAVARMPRWLAAAGAAVLLVPWSSFGWNRLTVPRAPAVTRYAGLRAFGETYRRRFAAGRPDVVQQQVHSLLPFCGFDEADPAAPRMTWRWSHDLRAARSTARPGTLFLEGFAAPGDEAELRAPYADAARFRDASFPFVTGGRTAIAVLFEAR